MCDHACVKILPLPIPSASMLRDVGRVFNFYFFLFWDHPRYRFTVLPAINKNGESNFKTPPHMVYLNTFKHLFPCHIKASKIPRQKSAALLGKFKKAFQNML